MQRIKTNENYFSLYKQLLTIPIAKLFIQCLLLIFTLIAIFTFIAFIIGTSFYSSGNQLLEKCISSNNFISSYLKIPDILIQIVIQNINLTKDTLSYEHLQLDNPKAGCLIYKNIANISNTLLVSGSDILQLKIQNVRKYGFDNYTVILDQASLFGYQTREQFMGICQILLVNNNIFHSYTNYYVHYINDSPDSRYIYSNLSYFYKCWILFRFFKIYKISHPPICQTSNIEKIIKISQSNRFWIHTLFPLLFPNIQISSKSRYQITINSIGIICNIIRSIKNYNKIFSYQFCCLTNFKFGYRDLFFIFNFSLSFAIFYLFLLKIELPLVKLSGINRNIIHLLKLDHVASILHHITYNGISIIQIYGLWLFLYLVAHSSIMKNNYHQWIAI